MLGLQFLVLNASIERDFETVFSTLNQRRAGALLIATDPFLNSRSEQLVALAARHGLPAMHTRPEFARAGELMSYGSSLIEVHRQVGIYIGVSSTGKSRQTCR
jgi:putative ABC transport system substrate-binding protein